MTRKQLIEAIDVERQLVEILHLEARRGVHADIPHAQAGFEAATARHAALQRLLDVGDMPADGDTP